MPVAFWVLVLPVLIATLRVLRGIPSAGLSRARGYSVHPDSPGTVLGCPGTSERDHDSFGSCVDSASGQADLASHAAHVDDAAAPTLCHLGRQGCG